MSYNDILHMVSDIVIHLIYCEISYADTSYVISGIKIVMILHLRFVTECFSHISYL